MKLTILIDNRRQTESHDACIRSTSGRLLLTGRKNGRGAKEEDGVNTPADNIRLSHEHGLSIYVETGGHRYLLDTGLSGKALDNAVTMGLDLTKIDALILSHGHIDHTGGLERFLQANHDAPIYASAKIATSDYQSDHHGKRHSLSPNQELIARNIERFHLLKENCQLSDNI